MMESISNYHDEYLSVDMCDATPHHLKFLTKIAICIRGRTPFMSLQSELWHAIDIYFNLIEVEVG